MHTLETTVIAQVTGSLPPGSRATSLTVQECQRPRKQISLAVFFCQGSDQQGAILCPWCRSEAQNPSATCRSAFPQQALPTPGLASTLPFLGSPPHHPHPCLRCLCLSLCASVSLPYLLDVGSPSPAHPHLDPIGAYQT